MKGIIRLHDPTSHGGRVISAAPETSVLGITVARKGDRCTCPIPGHGICYIAEGDPKVTIDGVPVAFEGHRTTCGASLITTVPKSTRD